LSINLTFKKCLEYQVLPSNIEKHLLTHPAVEDAAVVGLPHEVDGELPLAFIVLKAGQTATAEEIIQFISGKLENLALTMIDI
jgi:acyl-CoA synthetase (AMP-forming)/AMP-acid ligase II